MSDRQPKPFSTILPAYFFVIYAIFLLTNLLFLFKIGDWNFSVGLLIFSALIVYPFFQCLPAILLTTGAALLTAKKSRMFQAWITGLAAFLTVFPCALFLLLDAGLYHRYNYHFNPHVLNIFTTPGGFEGMGLETGEIVTFAVGIFLIALFHGGLIFAFWKFPKLAFAGDWSLKPFSFRRCIKYIVVLALGTVAFLISFFTYAVQHYRMIPEPLLAADALPFYIKGTSGSMFKALGIAKPERDAVQVRLSRNVQLDAYPAKPIERSTDRKKYNIVWLACESFAAKLYTPEIMPHTAEFAKKGVTFKRHYSGGNVTRQGMFSQFYALPANYWHPFLAAGRGPLFMDWLKADGYTFDCFTSSKFTYPEFDRTIFISVPSENMLEDYEGLSYKRDQRNVKRLVQAIEKRADSGKPFFAFMFFESPHHPYSFPPEARLYDDCMDPFNAVNATEKDGPAIFKRAANCAHHLDMRLKEVYDVLERKNLLDNTIVVLAGDHGEEYFEKGYLGHSSKFNNEQTMTPLILYYPGIKPGVYEKMSSHLDIVPMLAPLLGVRNDPADYSCGFDLLAENAPTRRYAIIANWDEVFFAGEKYKSLIPLDAVDAAKQVVTDSNDNPLDDVDAFYKEYNADLIQVQNDLNRFAAPAEYEGHPAVWITLAVLLLAGLIAGIVLYRKRKTAAE